MEEIGQVEAFDYPYIREGRRRPDPLPQLIVAHRCALAAARQKHRGSSLVLIGKSMGGRVGCHVSLAEQVDRLICLSYPLCGGGDPAKLRDQILRSITMPILFVQGTRDPLCPLLLLARVRSEMKAPNSLHIVAGGDHSLLLTKRDLAAAGETQEVVEQRILEAIQIFLHKNRPANGDSESTNSET